MSVVEMASTVRAFESAHGLRPAGARNANDLA